MRNLAMLLIPLLLSGSVSATEVREPDIARTVVNEVVPFFAVRSMEASLAFYIDNLGFEIRTKWVDDGVLRWCDIRLGDAGLMLQQYRTEGVDARTFSDNKGEGVTLCFISEDAVDLYRTWKGKGLNFSEPRVGNGLWVTRIRDPDGYRLTFQSPTDVAEGTKLSEVAGRK